MIEEFEITPFSLTLVGLLLLLALYLWLHPAMTSLKSHDGRIEESEGEYTSEQLNPQYGAYVWLAGKRFN